MMMPSSRTRLLPLLLVLVTVVAGMVTARTHLPYRDALAEDIRFWKHVFARLKTSEYVIHDSEHLGIIYRTVTIDSTKSDRQLDREEKAIKGEIEAMLLRFHAGVDPDTLSPWERHIHGLLDAIPEGDKFYQASRRVRAQRGIRENFLAGVRRSFAYLPYIRKVFAEKNLPPELVYLPHIESSFNPIARSHVGAAGMWQFMRGTARPLMKVNRIKDERYDPLYSTHAAARLLEYNHYVLRDWALAITAYNHGLGSMKKAKRRYGDYMVIRESYLRRSFGFASKNFYPEFLAVVEIMDSLDTYFPNIEPGEPLTFQEITLPKAVRLDRFATQFGVDASVFRDLNPGFHSSVWRGQRQVPAGYRLRLPMTVDPRGIVSRLGGDGEHLDQVRLVQRGSEPETIVITDLKTLNAALDGIRLAIAERRPGVRPAPSAVGEGAFQVLPRRAPVDSGAIALVETASPSDMAAPKPGLDAGVSGQALASVAATAPTDEVGAPLLAARSGNGAAFRKPAAVSAPTTGDRDAGRVALAVPRSERPLLAAADGSPVTTVKPGVDDQPDGPAGAAVFVAVAPAGEPVALFTGHGGAIRLEKPAPGEGSSWNPSLPAAVDARASGMERVLLANTAAVRSMPRPVVSDAVAAATVAVPAVAGSGWALNDASNTGHVAWNHPAVTEAPGHAGGSPLWLSAERSAPVLAASEAPEPPARSAPAAEGVAMDDQYAAASAAIYSMAEVRAFLQQRLTPRGETAIIYPEETLGHYSDWLGMPINELRRLNNISRGQRLMSGQRLRIAFTYVTPETFVRRRLRYHAGLVERVVTAGGSIELVDHVIQRGDNLWNLARRRLGFPANFLVYFNDLTTLERLYPGDVIKLPIIRK